MVISNLSYNKIVAVQNLLNHRSRKVLTFKNPADFYNFIALIYRIYY